MIFPALGQLGGLVCVAGLMCFVAVLTAWVLRSWLERYVVGAAERAGED